MEHPEYQYDIDNLIKQNLIRSKKEYITIEIGTIDEKVNFIYQTIIKKEQKWVN